MSVLCRVACGVLVVLGPGGDAVAGWNVRAPGVGGALATSGTAGNSVASGAVDEMPAWIEARLAGLLPEDPEAYFLLGEEIIAEPVGKAEEDLARQLFALAFELDRSDGSPSWIAPSSCLALASIARLESDERWLRALANRLDPRYAAPVWRGRGGAEGISEASLRAAEAVGEARAGWGVQASMLLDKPGVREVLGRYGRLMGFSSSTGALWQVEQWSREWPCRECGNERVVFRPNTDPPSYRECYTCRGNPGPTLSREQLVAHLRFESRLLEGISRSWGAQLALDGGAPLREPVAEELAAVMGVSVERPYWRAGWVANPSEGAPRGATVGAEPGG
jgi:hypothetical protein